MRPELLSPLPTCRASCAADRQWDEPCRLSLCDPGGCVMIDQPQQLGLMARLVLACLAALIVVGILWHGVTVSVFVRLWHNLVERPTGPMKFRFILQPVMATVAAVRDGRADALAGRAPYFMTVVGNRAERIGRLREGINATARIILLGLVMDLIYQVLVLGTFFPNEAVIIALLLAFVPYLIIRGLALRVSRRWISAPRAR